MIVRIVRMEFQAETIAEFDAMFSEIRLKIRQQPGCEHLELHSDPQNPLIRYTLSHWQEEKDLEQYRHSELFAQVWPRTKALFGGKPRAYSLSLMDRVELPSIS